MLLLLDCVGAYELATPELIAQTMPFLASLGAESARFPRAVSITPWTLPTHASLFTGLLPWEHGVLGMYGNGNLTLRPELPTVQDELHRSGYRTFCATSNWFLSPESGFLLTRGFDQILAATWWERYVRLDLKAGEPSALSPPGPEADGDGGSGLVRWLLNIPGDRLLRFPGLVRQLSRFLGKLNGIANTDGRVSNWIEPSFRAFLDGTPATTPVFGFLNLADAHEPYYLDPVRRDGSSTSRHLPRQDGAGWLNGRWGLDPDDMEKLRGCYRHALRILDGRIRDVVDSLRATGRWEQTLFVVTSDHGQSFGEDGILFHMFGVDDSLVRVPLVVRFPHRAHAGTVARGWASTIDIPATIAAASGVSIAPSTSARRLEELLDVPRPDPVVSISDGVIPPGGLGAMSPPVARRLSRRQVASYFGEAKITIDLGSGSAEYFEVGSESMQRPNREGRTTSDAQTAERLGREVAELLGAYDLRSIGPGRSPEVVERLRTWGYQ